MAESSFIDALAYYRTIFPDLASLGAGTPPAAWWAEFQEIAPAALDSTLGTGVTAEGGSTTGIANFRQVTRVRALHARRAELDPDYVNPYTAPVAAEPMPRRRTGFLVRI